MSYHLYLPFYLITPSEVFFVKFLKSNAADLSLRNLCV